MKDRIAIIGSGDLGQSIAHYAKENGYRVIGYYDDFRKEREVIGIPILGPLNKIETDYIDGVFDALVCAIGYKHFGLRESVFIRYHFELGIPFSTIIDNTAHIDKTAKIGEGVVVFPAALVDKGCVIENNVLLNVGVTIAHDSRVKEHSFLSPRCAIAGFSTIGKRCMIGINSTIIDNVSIGDDIRLGGASLVIEDLSIPGLYVGSPCIWKKK